LGLYEGISVAKMSAIYVLPICSLKELSNPIVFGSASFLPHVKIGGVLKSTAISVVAIPTWLGSRLSRFQHPTGSPPDLHIVISKDF